MFKKKLFLIVEIIFFLKKILIESEVTSKPKRKYTKKSQNNKFNDADKPSKRTRSKKSEKEYGSDNNETNEIDLQYNDESPIQKKRTTIKDLATEYLNDNESDIDD